MRLKELHTDLPGADPPPPTAGSLPESILSSLDVAVLERVEGRSFRLAGAAPNWFSALFETTTPDTAFLPGDQSAFLNHFLFDATQVWDGTIKSPKWLSSGPFTEKFSSGIELTLEAIALTVSSVPVLLLKFPTSDHETVRELLQQSRLQSLEYGRLVREINKREVLLHCIVHDLSAPLAGMKSSLELLHNDNLIRPGGEKLHTIGMNQIGKMQNMIKDILHAFRAEVGPLIPTAVEPHSAPDALGIVREVISILTPLASESNVTFEVIAESEIQDTTVAADHSRLERVVFNLIDNALRFAPSGSTVRISAHTVDGGVTIRVQDSGPGVEPALKPHLFERYSQGASGAGKAGLGLYFCQITLGDWGGKIGYDDYITYEMLPNYENHPYQSLISGIHSLEVLMAL